MKRKPFAIPVLLLIFLSVSVTAQQSSAPSTATSPPENQSGWIRPWRDATVSLGQVVNDGGVQTYYVVGSGIIVAVGLHKGAIITAKHVVFDPTQGWHPGELRMRFSWQEHKSITEELGIVVPLLDRDGNNLWVSSVTGSDLVAIPLNIRVPLPESLKAIEAIGPSDFATDADLFEGAQIIVLGFPVVMGQKFLVRPIVRSGIVAWTNPDHPSDQPFLVDSNLYPGNSGGPVLRVPTGTDRSGAFSVGGRVSLLGIVSEGPVQNAVVTAEGREIPYIDPVTHLPAKITARVIAVGGMGLVEPVNQLRKLLDQAFGPGSSSATPPK